MIYIIKKSITFSEMFKINKIRKRNFLYKIFTLIQIHNNLKSSNLYDQIINIFRFLSKIINFEISIIIIIDNVSNKKKFEIFIFYIRQNIIHSFFKTFRLLNLR